MFDLSSLQYNSAHPGLETAIFTVLFSVVLGLLLAFTYEKTSNDLGKPNHFLQAMVLVTIVSSTIIQAIGDSVARGLGMIGALSIIRFRTTIRDTRNIVFMFSAISIGIACGVFGFLIALVGTLGFSITAFLLHYSSFGASQNKEGTLSVLLDQSVCDKKELMEIIQFFCKKNSIIRQEITTRKGLNLVSFIFKVILKKEDNLTALLLALHEAEGIIVKKITLEQIQNNKI